MRVFEIQPDGLRLVHLSQVDPLLPVLHDVLYEYTIPQLSTRALGALKRAGEDVGPKYSGHRRSNNGPGRLEERYLSILEAARLISSMYSNVLDPLRFGGSDAGKPGRSEIFNAFVRTLVSGRILPCVELLALNIQEVRALDMYQDGLGTNASRWMQYLATEGLQTTFLQRGFTAGPELERLAKALYTIRESSSVLDRFKALSRASEGGA